MTNSFHLKDLGVSRDNRDNILYFLLMLQVFLLLLQNNHSINSMQTPEDLYDISVKCLFLFNARNTLSEKDRKKVDSVLKELKSALEAQYLLKNMKQ